MRRTYARIFSLLDRTQRRHFALLGCAMLVMGVLDLAGVASVLPFLGVLANPQIIENRDGLSWLYETLGFETTYGFLQFLGLCVFVLVMTSIAVRAFTFYLVTRFARGVATTLGIRLLRQYLARPFEWFLQQHSADLGKSVLTEVQPGRHRLDRAGGPGDRERGRADLARGLPALSRAGGRDRGGAPARALLRGDLRPPSRLPSGDRARPQGGRARALQDHHRGDGRHQGGQDPRPRGRLREALPRPVVAARPAPGLGLAPGRDAALRARGAGLRRHAALRALPALDP